MESTFLKGVYKEFDVEKDGGIILRFFYWLKTILLSHINVYLWWMPLHCIRLCMGTFSCWTTLNNNYKYYITMEHIRLI